MAQEEARKQIEKKFGPQASAMLPGGKTGGGGGGKTKVTQAQYEAHKPVELRKSVRMISGCQDRQTSADVSNVSSFRLPNQYTFIKIVLLLSPLKIALCAKHPTLTWN